MMILEIIFLLIITLNLNSDLTFEEQQDSTVALHGKTNFTGLIISNGKGYKCNVCM
ncbi:hypothetical protein Pint_19054 [Pistacia integerrima]|uniref:Uncharacterized protein n=1 Tax=Pistacia integerrima TaxID=434235 RepID=A0ACC0YT27_9ROSI|nr:hypothetical protein Pint_19054 [Pistacia integerrima]